MASGITVVFEYTQAVLLLVYYRIKLLGRILLVQKIVKNVENDIILVTGAGKLSKRFFEIIYHISFVVKVLDLVEVLRNDSPHTVQLSYFGMWMKKETKKQNDKYLMHLHMPKFMPWKSIYVIEMMFIELLKK